MRRANVIDEKGGIESTPDVATINLNLEAQERTQEGESRVPCKDPRIGLAVIRRGLLVRKMIDSLTPRAGERAIELLKPKILESTKTIPEADGGSASIITGATAGRVPSRSRDGSRVADTWGNETPPTNSSNRVPENRGKNPFR